jgi:hypothetical protein
MMKPLLKNIFPDSPKPCFQNRTTDRTAERELSQLAAATLAMEAFFLEFRADVWRSAAD